MGAMDDLLKEYEEEEPVAAPAKDGAKKGRVYPSSSELFVGDSPMEEETAATVQVPTPKPTKAENIAKIESGLQSDALKAMGYAGLRGATLQSSDTLHATGVDLGETLGAADWANGNILSRIPESLWPTSLVGPQPSKNAAGSPRPADPLAYEKARAEYQQDEARAREGNEKKAFASETLGGLIPALATGGSGVPVSVAGRTIPSATANLARNVAAPGFVSGAMAEPSSDLRKQALSGLQSSALGLGVDAAVAPVVRKLVTNAPERMGRGIIHDVGTSAEGAASTPSARQRIVQKREGIIDELVGSHKDDQSKLLRKELRGSAEEALGTTRARLSKISEPRDALYQSLDAVEMLDLGKIQKGLRDAVKGARNETEQKVLQSTLDSFEKFWLPKFQREGNLVTRVNKPAAVKGAAARQWVTEAQAPAADVLGSIAVTEHKKLKDATADAVTGVWQSHLDDVARSNPQAKGLVDSIREYDKRASSLLEMKKTLEQRLIKEEQNAMGWGARTRKGVEGFALAGAAASELTGHGGALLPTIGAIATTRALPPTVRAVNDNLLVPLALAIRRGASWAEVADFAAKTGLPQGLARAAFDRYSVYAKEDGK